MPPVNHLSSGVSHGVADAMPPPSHRVNGNRLVDHGNRIQRSIEEQLAIDAVDEVVYLQ